MTTPFPLLCSFSTSSSVSFSRLYLYFPLVPFPILRFSPFSSNRLFLTSSEFFRCIHTALKIDALCIFLTTKYIHLFMYVCIFYIFICIYVYTLCIKCHCCVLECSSYNITRYSHHPFRLICILATAHALYSSVDRVSCITLYAFSAE